MIKFFKRVHLHLQCIIIVTCTERKNTVIANGYINNLFLELFSVKISQWNALITPKSSYYTYICRISIAHALDFFIFI